MTLRDAEPRIKIPEEPMVFYLPCDHLIKACVR
jgi:hypothetical protein